MGRCLLSQRHMLLQCYTHIDGDPSSGARSADYGEWNAKLLFLRHNIWEWIHINCVENLYIFRGTCHFLVRAFMIQSDYNSCAIFSKIGTLCSWWVCELSGFSQYLAYLASPNIQSSMSPFFPFSCLSRSVLLSFFCPYPLFCILIRKCCYWGESKDPRVWTQLEFLSSFSSPGLSFSFLSPFLFLFSSSFPKHSLSM